MVTIFLNKLNLSEKLKTLRLHLQHRRRKYNPGVGRIPWWRKWQPIPIFFPEKYHGQRSLVGYSPKGRKELDTTEHSTQQDSYFTFLGILVTVKNTYLQLNHAASI